MSEKEQAALAKKEYMRQWRKNNKEKISKHSQRYWARKYLEQQTDLQSTK